MRTFTYLKSALILAVMFVAGSAFAQTVIFEESFAGFAKGAVGSTADGTDVSTKLDEFTTAPGWQGSKVYQAGGASKMGTSSALGYLVTPSIDLSDASATYTLQFKACAWSKDATDMKVYVDDVVVYTASGLDNADYTLASYTTTITGTAASKIKFEGAQASKGRFFLDDVVVIKSTGGVLPPVVMLPAKVDFATVKPGESTVENITLSASNLTGDLTVALEGTGFTLTSSTTITKAQAEAGTTIDVTFAPSVVNSYNGTLTVSGGGLTESKVVALAGKALSLVGEGTEANPFTVADVIALGNTNVGPHWVKGYIVGAIVFEKPSEYVAPFSTATALYMGDNMAERDSINLVPVQLPAGDLRVALNLKDNPENLGKVLTIKGNLEAYFSMPGLRSPSEYTLSTGPTSISNSQVANRIYANGGKVVVDASQDGMIEVYNVVGQKVRIQQGVEGNNEVGGLNRGQVYIVKFAGKTQKVILW